MQKLKKNHGIARGASTWKQLSSVDNKSVRLPSSEWHLATKLLYFSISVKDLRQHFDSNRDRDKNKDSNSILGQETTTPWEKTTYHSAPLSTVAALLQPFKLIVCPVSDEIVYEMKMIMKMDFYLNHVISHLSLDI